MKKLTLISFFGPMPLIFLGEVLPFDPITVLIMFFVPLFILFGVMMYLTCKNEFDDGLALLAIPLVLGTTLGTFIFQPVVPTPAVIIVAISFSGGLFAGPVLFIEYCLGADFTKIFKTKNKAVLL